MENRMKNGFNVKENVMTRNEMFVTLLRSVLTIR
jgi:hypothetical protein